MSATLRVPTIFTARDGVSSVLRAMGRGVQTFANSTQRAVNGSNRLFKRLTPSIGEAGKQMLSMVSSATLVAAAFAGMNFSVEKVMEYEDAVAAFRTIVSDLNNTQFAKFEGAIGQVATKTKKSTVDVANSFEMIAGLNAKFAETSTGLAQVSEAAITLSKASKDELGVSASNLVGIMNQFNLGAEQADRVINVLAAGQAVGAASITEASESYKNFGSVASSSNITLEQSIGLIQTLAKNTIKGAEAGTALRGVTLKLQKAGLGYKSGQFQINDALEQTNKIYRKLKDSKAKDNFLIKVFGAENISAGKILLNNIPVYHEFTKGVTGTSEAQKAASINSNTLRSKIDELKNTWVNYLTTNDKTNEGLNKVKDSISYVTENLSTIIKWVWIAVKAFTAWKVITLIVEAALIAYNVVLGIFAALNTSSAVALGTNTIALNAWYITTMITTKAMWLWNGVMKAVTAAQWLWNAAMTANPIGLIIVGIGALIAAVVLVIKYWDEWGATVTMLAAFFTPWLSFIISLVMSLYNHWGMITKAFKEGGIIGGLKAIGKVLLDVVLKPVQQLLTLLAKIPGLSGLATAGADKIGEIRASLGLEDGTKQALDSPAINQQKITNESIKTTRNNLDINVNDPNENVTVVSNNFKKNPVKVTKTKGQR